MAETVLYEVTDGLATVTLNRPEAMNALDVTTKEALRDSLQRAAADSSVRAVLLSGKGRSFCVGQDLKEHLGTLRALSADGGETGESGGTDPAAAQPQRAGTRGSLRTVELHYNPITEALAGMPKPVVAAVNGPAAGAGFGFALAADYRIAAASATFTTAFAGVGLSADSGLSWTLPRAVGPGRAAELLLFPRRIGAQEAERLGIVQRVVPDEELADAALAAARELAAGPTVAYAAIKEALAYAADHSLTEALQREAALQARAGATADHREAVAAFVSKKRPVFRGR
ncbi:enoyl-CoA hydratase/isomerase family protein [Streptomyces sp. 7-21]|uniref:enoyl-CoA hydratase/isomerase family protein n=1 Tax=Streptomyces sp. 7-21 TaxID=2802283 RepID=UPI00191CE306|nr:enoyl-CoA hydratase-related protein [Streptomyces sp. 7-21]MBL1066287.1 enoyl-CoA hydratase/isomerase family protein [Streptomyces sp. 7-21]